MTKEQPWFQTSNLIQARQRSEELCFAEDHFKCWKTLMQQVMNSVRHARATVRALASRAEL